MSKRIHVRTVIEPLTKHPVESIQVYPYHMVVRFRKKQSALDIFNAIIQGSKGKRTSRKQLDIGINIRFDPSTHFRRPTGTLIITGDMYAALEFMQRKMSPRSFNNLQYAISKRPNVIIGRIVEDRRRSGTVMFKPFTLAENVEISHRIAGTNLYQN
jgi:hypothetical protein